MPMNGRSSISTFVFSQGFWHDLFHLHKAEKRNKVSSGNVFLLSFISEDRFFHSQKLGNRVSHECSQKGSTGFEARPNTPSYIVWTLCALCSFGMVDTQTPTPSH